MNHKMFVPAFQGTFQSMGERRHGLESVLEMLNPYTKRENRMRVWGKTYWIFHRTGP